VTGAGGSELIESKLENDVFVTGELKWNEAVYANDHHVSVLILGHYMENYFVNYLGQLLQDNFNDLTIATFDIMNQVKNY
jgi:putative NIF3 family GTP cyclohydrolase 1 type 2